MCKDHIELIYINENKATKAPDLVIFQFLTKTNFNWAHEPPVSSFDK